MDKTTRKIIFIFLTLVSALFAVSSYAAISLIAQEASDTHMRLNIIAEKDHLVINKKGDKVFIRTLNSMLFNKLKRHFKKVSLNKNYISSMDIVPSQNASSVNAIQLTLANPQVELFTFYRGRQKSYALDFWVEKDASLFNGKEKVIKGKKGQGNKKVVKLKAPKKFPKVLKPKKKTAKKKLVKSKKKNWGYKDFRYGAAFLWDYAPLAPKLKDVIQLGRKTPEFFYPIKNRDYEKSDHEAHLQLAINLYRKKKWGLMYKSLKIFDEKYFDVNEDKYIVGDYSDLIEYLKANAILRENLDRGNEEPVKQAIAILDNILKRSKDYELKKAIYKYLLTYFVHKKDFIRTLEMSKRFYVESKENFDYEELNFSSEVIVYSLARLNQIDKVKKILIDPTIKKILPKQILYSYRIFTHHKLGETKEVIKFYESIKSQLQKPVHEIILFNVAEAYFRKAKYKKAVKLFDNFLASYSFHTYSSYARLRIAQAYDLLGQPPKKVAVLYKNAINRSQIPEVSYEARIRYVALETIRKSKVTEQDLEQRVFLEQKELKELSEELKKLLWQVRLRTFIKDKKYHKALSYLNVLPLNTMTASERRTFESDGAEIIFGLIVNHYKNGNFSKLVRSWEFFQDRYLDKVARDPYLNNLVAKSYLKLGLMDGFDRTFAKITKIKDSPEKSYPVWIKRPKIFSSNIMIPELRIARNIKLKNWNLVKKNLAQLKKIAPKLNRISYYQGLVDYQQKKYELAIVSFENFLYKQKHDDIYNASEVADILYAYTDSIYKTGDLEKYKKTAKAVLSDTTNYAPDHKYTQKVRERVAYLNVEILAGESKKASTLLVEKYANDFLKEFKESEYVGRVKFILATSYVENKNEDKGVSILNEIVNDTKIGSHIKEMAKSELSLINIKNRNL